MFVFTPAFSEVVFIECEYTVLQLVKLCIGMIDAGRVYNQANKQFVNGIRELALQSTRDEVIGVRDSPDQLSFLLFVHH